MVARNGVLTRFGRRARARGEGAETPVVAAEDRAPWLASDARRTVIAGLVSILPSTGFDRVLDRLDFGPDELLSDVAIVVCSFLVGWICFAVIYAIMTTLVFVRADGATFGRWLRASEPRSRLGRFLEVTSGGSVTIWTTQGSLIAVLSVLVLLLVPELRTSMVVTFSGVLAVTTSWVLNAVSFAMHYARKDAMIGSLRFSGDDAATFSDYFYLSVQISTSYSSGDVSVLTRRMRRTITVQTLLSFAFNTVIIAVLISVLVSAAR